MFIFLKLASCQYLCVWCDVPWSQPPQPLVYPVWQSWRAHTASWPDGTADTSGPAFTAASSTVSPPATQGWYHRDTITSWICMSLWILMWLSSWWRGCPKTVSVVNETVLLCVSLRILISGFYSNNVVYHIVLLGIPGSAWNGSGDTAVIGTLMTCMLSGSVCIWCLSADHVVDA